MTLKHKGAELLKADIAIAIKAVKKGEAVIFIIDGYLGSGKTSTASVIATEIQPSFEPKKQIGRGAEQFQKAWEYTESIKAGRGVKVCIFDEAQDVDKASHASKRNRAVRMFLDTFRDAKTILILCLPHFSRLENSIYTTGAVRALFHIDEQHKTFLSGRAFEPDNIDKMLDFLHRNRNDPNQSKKKVYKDNWRNYYFTILKTETKRQTMIDRASNRGKKRLRSKALRVAASN